MSEENKKAEPEQPAENILKEIVTADETAMPETETVAVEQQTTTNDQPQTDDMEVHHHTHASHGKKNWKSYFWEFLMLFLAVFCGFLAEYQLEHKIEHDRELQFITSLVADLQDDETSIQQNISVNRSRIDVMDSFLNIISRPELLKKGGNDAYYMARVGPRILPLTNNNKTFEQLKNSGGFRLIRSNETANRIMGYYNKLPLIIKLEALYFDEFAYYKTMVAKLFDPVIFRAMEKANGDISREANNPQLRTTNVELLKEFGIYIVYMNGTTRSIVPLEQELLQNGRELIDYLKNKYHLE